MLCHVNINEGRKVKNKIIIPGKWDFLCIVIDHLCMVTVNVHAMNAGHLVLLPPRVNQNTIMNNGCFYGKSA
jgi:hypothetical protein